MMMMPRKIWVQVGKGKKIPQVPPVAAVAVAASNGLFLLNRNSLLFDDGEDDITVCCILVSFLVFFDSRGI